MFGEQHDESLWVVLHRAAARLQILESDVTWSLTGAARYFAGGACTAAPDKAHLLDEDLSEPALTKGVVLQVELVKPTQ